VSPRISGIVGIVGSGCLTHVDALQRELAQLTQFPLVNRQSGYAIADAETPEQPGKAAEASHDFSILAECRQA
jgi:hypothetical protein